MSSRPAVSVIVCTRNRSHLLEDACRAMLEMEAPGIHWELLIVDNDSTDDTLELALEEGFHGPSCAEDPGAGKRVGDSVEPIGGGEGIVVEEGEDLTLGGTDPGISGGRETELLLDHRADSPRVVTLDAQGELPEWLDERFLPYLTVWDKGPQVLPLTYNEYPRGANIAYRREAFERFGLFSPHLGRKGRALTSCEEIEHCLRIERGGGQIVYTPSARIQHWVDASRITPEWMVRRFAAQGRSEAIIHWQHAGHLGLRRGLRVYLANARRTEAGASTADGLFHRCSWAMVRAFFLACIDVPFRIPRYRPLPEAGPPKRWLPFQ